MDFLEMNPLKIQTKAIEKFKPGRCWIVVKGWLSWYEATKMGLNTENNMKHTRKYSSDIQ